MDPQVNPFGDAPQQSAPAPMPNNNTPVTPATPIAAAPKKSKLGLILGLSIGGGVVLIGVLITVLLLVVGGGVKYDTANLQTITSGNASVKVDTSWTKGSSSGMTTYTDYVNKSQTSSGDPNNAGVMFGSQTISYTTLSDSQYSTMIDQVDDQMGDMTSSFVDGICKSGSNKAGDTNKITVGSDTGWQLAVDCQSKETDEALVGTMKIVISHDGKMYMLVVAALRNVWNANTDYFNTIQDSFTIDN